MNKSQRASALSLITSSSVRLSTRAQPASATAPVQTAIRRTENNRIPLNFSNKVLRRLCDVRRESQDFLQHCSIFATAISQVTRSLYSNRTIKKGFLKKVRFQWVSQNTGPTLNRGFEPENQCIIARRPLINQRFHRFSPVDPLIGGSSDLSDGSFSRSSLVTSRA